MILESRKTTLILVLLILVLLVPVVGRLKIFAFGKSVPALEKISKEKNVGPELVSAFAKQDQNFSKKGEVSILFGGDMMFDRYIRQVVERKGFDYVLGDVKDVLRGVDFAVANLEGPITGSESKSVGSEFGSKENYIFTFPRGTADGLWENNISVVSIGNNHILNFGQDGLFQTRQELKRAGVRYFGDPEDPAYSSYVKEFNGLKIGFACYNEFADSGSVVALDEIVKLEKEADAVILYAHWGAEYETHSNQKQRDLARKFVDAGADLVIGSHTHVIQESETYQGKKIYYSLGNFVFDQYFEDSTKEGILVEAVISSDGDIETKETEIQMDSSGKTSLKL